MVLITLLVLLLVVGGVLYVVDKLPIDSTIATIIKVVAVLALAIYVLLKIVAPLIS